MSKHDWLHEYLIYIYLKREIIHHLIKEFESPVIDWYTRITKETFRCFRNNSNCFHDQKPHSSFEMLFHHPVTTYLPVVGRTDYCFLFCLVIQIQLCSAGMSFFIDRFLWLPVKNLLPHLLTFVWCHCKHMTSLCKQTSFLPLFSLQQSRFLIYCAILCVNEFLEFWLTSH